MRLVNSTIYATSSDSSSGRVCCLRVGVIWRVAGAILVKEEAVAQATMIIYHPLLVLICGDSEDFWLAGISDGATWRRARRRSG